jgi:hypothetical protein
MTWTADDLDRIGTAEELHVTPDLPSSAAGRTTTIWVVRVGDDLYVRSYRGAAGSWYRHATASGSGHVSGGGVEADVTFEPAPDIDPAAVDSAYQTKYARYGDTYVKPMVSPAAQVTTLRLQTR